MKFSSYLDLVRNIELKPSIGRVSAIQGIALEATGCQVSLGELVVIKNKKENKRILAEVVGLSEGKTYLMPFEGLEGLCLESKVVPSGETLKIPVGQGLLGRVVDALCVPLDDVGEILVEDYVNSKAKNINPLSRTPINESLSTGVKAIDAFIPLGKGQRLGIFAGSGVGKSTLIGMISKFILADVIVIALIGERGREVQDFIKLNLGNEGLKKAVLIVATAAEPAVLRRQAAYTATAIAEWFRDKNKSVLLIMDSITRFVMAQREIGISVGETLGARGYPPSALALLPPLIERVGNLDGAGSISAIYTVLVEGDDFNEPVSDHMRSILDGHIMLDRALAARGRYPAIDVLRSISRLSGSLWNVAQRDMINKIKDVMSNYEDSKELIDLGLYKKGTNLTTDLAIEHYPEIVKFLVQSENSFNSWNDTWKRIESLFRDIQGA